MRILLLAATIACGFPVQKAEAHADRAHQYDQVEQRNSFQPRRQRSAHVSKARVKVVVCNRRSCWRGKATVTLTFTPRSEYDHAPNLVQRARSFVGQGAREIGLHRTSLWCSAFLRHVAGTQGVNDLALSWLNRPRVTASIGAIAVMHRGRGGHVGIVSGFDRHGNPILISGNHGRRVRETVYPRHRIVAYVAA